MEMARLATLTIASLLGASSALASAACPPLKLPVGESIQTLGNRSFHLYIPKSYAANISAVPIILYLHGWTEKCADYPRDFIPNSDKRGFIFVSLCGTGGGAGSDDSFNAGTCCAPANDDEIDDVAVARSVIGNLSQQLCIDPARVFATGFSNGGMMVQVLACKASDLFTAIASAAAVVELKPGWEAGLSKCNDSYALGPHNVNLLDVHGHEDIVVPWDGDLIFGYVPIPENMNNWAWRNLCKRPPVQTWSNGTFSNQVWKGCGIGGKATIELMKNEKGGHEWPALNDFHMTNYAVEWLYNVTA